MQTLKELSNIQSHTDIESSKEKEKEFLSSQNTNDVDNVEGQINLIFGNKSKKVFWLDLVRTSEFFSNMKLGCGSSKRGEEHVDELTIPDVVEEEFEGFLYFFIPPYNINTKVTMKNLGYVTILADRFICPNILHECELLLMDRAKYVTSPYSLDFIKLGPEDQTMVFNLAHKYFGTNETLFEWTSKFRISQMIIPKIENMEWCRTHIAEHVRSCKELSVRVASSSCTATTKWICQELTKL
jgi:hypothetical protein